MTGKAGYLSNNIGVTMVGKFGDRIWVVASKIVRSEANFWQETLLKKLK